MQVRRYFSVSLCSYKQGGGHEFVHFGLEFKLQLCDLLIPGGIPGQVDKMAHTLKYRPEVAEVSVMEFVQRVFPPQPIQHGRVQIDRQIDIVAICDDEDLFVNGSQTRHETETHCRLRTGDEKLGNTGLASQVIGATNDAL